MNFSRLRMCQPAFLLGIGVISLVAPWAGTATAEEEFGAPLRTEDIKGPIRTESIDLARCFRLTLSQNLDLEIAGFSPRIASTQVDEVRATRDPILSFSIGRNRSKIQTGSTLSGASLLVSESNFGTLGISRTNWLGTTYSLTFGINRTHSNNQFSTLNPSFDTNMTFTVTQPLLRNFGFEKNRASLKLAEFAHRQAIFSFQQKVLDILQQVEKSYWDLVLTQADVGLNKESVSLAKDLLRITRIRKRVGEVTRIEELEAEAGLASAEQQLILAEKAQRQAQDTLKLLIQPKDMSYLWNVTLLPTAEIPFQLPSLPHHPVDEIAAINRALAWRPELLSLRQGVDAKSIALEEARDDLLPKLDVEGSVKLTGLADDLNEAFDDNKSGRYFQWSASLVLEIPIGNRSARSLYARAHLDRQLALAQVHQLERQLIHEVRLAAREVLSTTLQINAAKKVTRLNTEKYEAEKKRFQVGQSTRFRIDEFREEYTQARTSEVSAYIAYQKALADLKRAEGSSLKSLEDLGIQLRPSRR